MLGAASLHQLIAETTDYTRYYKNLPIEMKQAVAPVIPDLTVKITDYGAVGDGITLCTDAVEKAISYVSKQGGGHVVIPNGVWLCGPIQLKDNIDLHLEKNALLIFSPDKRLFLSDNITASRCQPAIRASKRSNISITGSGTIDGNGKYWRPVKHQKVSSVEWSGFKQMGGSITEKADLWYPYNLKNFKNVTKSETKEEGLRADLIRVTECKNVRIEGVTVQNSPRFHVHPVRCQNVIIDGVRVRCPWNAQNGDGIDVSNCSQVLIVGCIVDVGDDGICMKGGIGTKGVKDGPCIDVLVAENVINHAHGGFVLGSDAAGGLKNTVVRDCTMSGTDVGIRFKSSVGRGGKTENVFITNISMNDIKDAAVSFSCAYEDKGFTGKSKWDASNVDVSAKMEEIFAPQFQDIHMDGIVCRESKVGIAASGIEGMECVHDIYIDNSTFFYTKDDTKIDETSASIIIGRNVNFVTYDRVKKSPAEKD